MTSWIVKTLLFLLRCYQWTVGPLLGRCCRFDPGCSTYAMAALHKYGLFAGLWLAIRRVGRCHPWHPGGYDPVP